MPRRHYFPVQNVTVITVLAPHGEYGAYVEDDYDGQPITAWGTTRLEAIADLYNQRKDLHDIDD